MGTLNSAFPCAVAIDGEIDLLWSEPFVKPLSTHQPDGCNWI